MWLRGGNRQTLYPHFFRREPPPPLEHELLATPDGDDLSIHHMPGRADLPRLVVFHGLEGSIHSSYVKGIIRAFYNVGWPATVMEHRSCDGRTNRAPRLYHCGETTDLAHVVQTLTQREPTRALFLVGFSLGANQLLKWLGDEARDVPQNVIGAAAVSPPFDLMISGPHLDRVLFGAYTKHFLRTLIPKALAKAEQFPDKLDAVKIRKARSFREFDTHGTAALHGFKDAQDYWARVSSGQFLKGIRVPTLLLASADDPFNPEAALPKDTSSPYLVPLFTRRGGHVGWVTGSAKAPRYWAEEQIIRFAEVVAGRA
jgi:predicted alpha/beta-fold hydrolase